MSESEPNTESKKTEEQSEVINQPSEGQEIDILSSEMLFPSPQRSYKKASGRGCYIWAAVTSIAGFLLFIIPMLSLYSQPPAKYFDASQISGNTKIVEINSSANTKIAELNSSNQLTIAIACVICGLLLQIVALILFKFYNDILERSTELERINLAIDLFKEQKETDHIKYQTLNKIVESLVNYEVKSQSSSNENQKMKMNVEVSPK